MTIETVVIVYPSLFAENKINQLIENIKKILKIKNLKFGKIFKDDFLICIYSDDPVFVSSAIGLLFGIKQIAIAKKIKNDFKTIVSQVSEIGSNLLLKGEKFYVKVDGKTKGFVIKDLELAATSKLIEKNQKILAKPGTKSKYDKLLQIYVTKSNAYVCIFVDQGLGGTANNSQLKKSICCISDEFSAISCLETIKQGFDIKPILCYETREDLIHLVKILDKLLPRMLRLDVELEFHKIPKFEKKSEAILSKSSLVTNIMIKSAKQAKIPYVSLTTSPLIFPLDHVEILQKQVFSANLIPHVALSGIDSEIIKNAKEIGMDKYISKIEKFAGTNFSKVKSKLSKGNISKKIIKIKLGPNNVHTILDSLEIEH